MQQFIELMFWSLVLAFITAVIYKVFINQSEMRRIKAETKDLKEKANKAQKAGDLKESSRLMSEMLKTNNALFRMNMKPMFVSFIAFLVPLYWLFPMMFEKLSVVLPFYIPFLGTELNWLFWYIIVILAGNFIFRKLLGVE
jgi:uncharacterized membrane protein (DUF106 family)